MISVLVRTHCDDSVALGMTLRAIIPGVVHGLVGDAVIAAPEHVQHVRRIVDTVGASFVISPEHGCAFAAAAASARSDILLLLDAGDVLLDPWIHTVEHHLPLLADGSAFIPRSGRIRFFEKIQQRLVSPRRPVSGLLVSKKAFLLQRSFEKTPVRLSAKIDSQGSKMNRTI